MDIARQNMLLLALFPHAENKYRSALRKLVDQKGINWLNTGISQDLHDLMYSIIRHRGTHYDECVGRVGKEKARFYVQGEVSSMMKRFKGERG
jgi:hypothetical protein